MRTEERKGGRTDALNYDRGRRKRETMGPRSDEACNPRSRDGTALPSSRRSPVLSLLGSILPRFRPSAFPPFRRFALSPFHLSVLFLLSACLSDNRIPVVLYSPHAAPGLVASALCVVNVLFAWRWLAESRPAPGREDHAPRRPIWHPAWLVVRHPGNLVSRLVWIYGIGMVAFSAMTSVLALYLGAKFGLTEKTIGWIFAYVGVLSLVMRSLLLGPIVDRLGESWTMRSGALLLAAGLLLYPIPQSLWPLAAVIPLVPIGTALLFPSTTSLMSRYSDPREVGTTMGVAQTFSGLARVVAPLVATTIFQRLGHDWPFYVAGGIVTLAGALTLQIPREARLATPAAEEAGAT